MSLSTIINEGKLTTAHEIFNLIRSAVILYVRVFAIWGLRRVVGIVFSVILIVSVFCSSPVRKKLTMYQSFVAATSVIVALDLTITSGMRSGLRYILTHKLSLSIVAISVPPPVQPHGCLSIQKGGPNRTWIVLCFLIALDTSEST